MEIEYRVHSKFASVPDYGKCAMSCDYISFDLNPSVNTIRVEKTVGPPLETPYSLYIISQHVR